jgi:succinate dehydrogenase/fumarate reductase cytochrome b subunit
VFTLSIVFAGLSGVALAHSIRAYKRYPALGRWVHLHSTIVALTCFGMTLWLMHHGIIGLRTWTW